MSERNGDKARFQKNRKRKLHARAQIRALIAGAGVKPRGESVPARSKDASPAPEARKANAGH